MILFLYLYYNKVLRTNKIIIFALGSWLLALGSLHAQLNLVQNSSFEIYSSCPNGSGFPNDIAKAIPWYNPTGCSPDYFDSCNITNNGFNVPVNFRGYQFARTGAGYAGIGVFEYTTSAREYIQVKLSDTLIAGKKYMVNYFVSLADSSSYAVNKMGAYLSPNTFFQSGCSKLSYTPQIINSTKLLNDRIGWTEVSDTLMAVGGELYITIGNFFSNSQCDTMYYGNGPNNDSYYYIDDVSVIDVAEISVNELGIKNAELRMYPNPACEVLTIEFENPTQQAEIYILDLLGNEIRREKMVNTKLQIDLSKIETGVYFVSAKTDAGVERKRFIVQH